METRLELGSKWLAVDVDQLTVVTEGLEAVRETWRYDKGLRIISVEDLRVPVHECRRAPSDVNNDIKDAAAGTGDDLRLTIRCRLKVKAAHSSTSASCRVVDLEYRHAPERGQIPARIE